MIWLEVLERTWKELRKEKTEAKTRRKDLKQLDKLLESYLEEIEETREKLSISFARLIPDKENHVYITLELLEDSGLFYKKLRHDLQIEIGRKEIEKYWRMKNYKEVVERSNKIIDWVNAEIKKWRDG